ncbi:hypothetical protein F183_A45850 [Bryobacterales bacterium F-183]|nr:hypothetical protein F183_A45850 [Bryobacterales bacterium F-183]
MAAANPKSKMISFRISDREYEILKALHPHQGARNLSDFARTAMLRHLKTETMPPEPTLADLTSRLDSLQQDVHRLLELLGPSQQAKAAAAAAATNAS